MFCFLFSSPPTRFFYLSIVLSQRHSIFVLFTSSLQLFLYVCVCLCVNLCVFLLFWSPLSLFALSCSFALTLCLALAPSCTKLITVFSSLVAALYIFPLAFSRTHTSRSLFVFLFFLLSISLCFAVFPSSLFCFVVFFFLYYFVTATLSRALLSLFSLLFSSLSFRVFLLPASSLLLLFLYCFLLPPSFLPSFRFKFTQFLIV